MKKDARKIDLLAIENYLYAKGYQFIAGVDEAGRGPLAGPVMTAACILPKNFKLQGLNDSKKLSERKREELSKLIKEQALAWSLGRATVEEIDALNILQATRLAMQRAVEGMSLVVKPDYVLIDGKDSIQINHRQKSVISGDSLSANIAAASILAKVARDKYMSDMHHFYMQYGFDQHKGYGTKAHLEALKEFGPCPIHRRTFSPIKQMI